MRRLILLLLAMPAVLACGVPKEEHEALQSTLAACEEEKISAQAAVMAWEQRFDRESSRWEEMEASISDALPRALSDFHAEKERLVEQMPENVQAELDAYLEDYFVTVMAGFDRLVSDNKEIKLELKATQRVLDRIGGDTQEIRESTTAIDDALDEAFKEERGLRFAERAKREAIEQDLTGIVSHLTEWDRTRINCKQCPERLTLSRKERETITALHGDLIRRLTELQASAGQNESPAAPAETGEGDGAS